MIRLRQPFERPRVEDVAAAVACRPGTPRPAQRASAPDRRWRLTAGSRGIANIPPHPAQTAALPQGARRPAVPRAGDGQPRRRHGRGTAPGPRKLRHHRGVRRRAHPRLDGRGLARHHGRRLSGLARQASPPRPITSASSARVKPHTSYHGPIESGLLKMMMIGLGKHAGALAYHRILLEQPYDQVVRSVGRAHARQGADRLRSGRGRERLRRNRPGRSRRARGFRAREESSCLAMARRLAGPAAVRRRPTCSSSTRSARTSAAPAWTPTSSAASAPSRKTAPPDQPTMRLIFVRGLTRAHARQRHRHRPGRLHHHPARQGHELPGHASSTA